jgi:hypothetical protein
MSSDVMSTVGVGVVLVINVVHVEVDVRTVVVNELKMPRSAGSSGKLSLRSLDVGLCLQVLRLRYGKARSRLQSLCRKN